MKKSVYGATKVKKINLKKLQEEVKGLGLILAVDVAKEDFVAVIMEQDQQVHSTIKWKHPGGLFFLN